MKRKRHSNEEVAAYRKVAPIVKQFGVKVIRRVVQRCAVENTIRALEKRAKSAQRALRAQKEKL